MHITQQTPSKLVLRNRTRRADVIDMFVLTINGLLLSAVFTILPNLGVIQIECDRTAYREARCVVKRARLLGVWRQPSKTQAYERVRGAISRTWRGWEEEEPPPFGSWIALRTPEGELPAFGGFRLRDQARTLRMSQATDDINHFLASELPSLSLQILPNWEWKNRVILLGLFWLPPCLKYFFLCTLRSEVVVFDLKSRQIDRVRHTFLNKQTSQIATFNQVQQVEIHRYPTGDYAIAFLLKNGRRRKLPRVPHLPPLEATREAIRTTLNLS